MQIEKNYCYSILSASLAMSLDTTVAQHHASLFPTRLALARWTVGGDVPHTDASERAMPMRAAWYAQAGDRFQTWLADGGFHRADESLLDCVVQGQSPDTPFPVPGIGNWPAANGA